MKQYMTSGLD